MKIIRCAGGAYGLIAIAAMLALGGAGVGRATESEDMALLKKTSKAFAAIARKAMPAVVSVRVEKTFEARVRGRPRSNDEEQTFEFNGGDEWLRRFFRQYQNPDAPRQFKQVGQGSGFLINKEGYILTNNHVVGDADKIRVRLHDGREFDAKRIGSDSKSEVAVIKIEGNDFPFLTMGDSGALEIGEWVIAIGSPFGLSETLTVGVVSAKGRSNVQITDYEDFIQTDAAINPGNSGGPLLNINGEAIGLNTAIYSQSGGYQGIGFAIPIVMTKAIMDQLISTGKVIRGFLGVHIQEVTSELAESFGLKQRSGILVADVEKGSPAEGAGLRQADIILKLNGKDVESVSSFRTEISSTPPGTSVTLTLRRDDKVFDVKVKTGSLPDGSTAAAGESGALLDKLGLAADDLTKENAERFGYALNEGVLVTGVEDGSVAAMAGMTPGNLITGVNRKRISSLADFNSALSSAKEGKTVLLHVRDGRFSRYLVLKVD